MEILLHKQNNRTENKINENTRRLHSGIKLISSQHVCLFDHHRRKRTVHIENRHACNAIALFKCCRCECWVIQDGSLSGYSLPAFHRDRDGQSVTSSNFHLNAGDALVLHLHFMEIKLVVSHNFIASEVSLCIDFMRLLPFAVSFRILLLHDMVARAFQ